MTHVTPDGLLLLARGTETTVATPQGRFRLPVMLAAAAGGLAAPDDPLRARLSALGLGHPVTEDLAGRRVRIIGSGPLAAAAAESLLRLGPGELQLVDPEPPQPEDYPGTLHSTGGAALRQRLEAAVRSVPGAGPAARTRLRVLSHWAKPEVGSDLSVVATGYAEPDRAITDTLLRGDQPHLLVRPHGRGVLVGPLVLPGRTPCVGCADLLRADRESDWPGTLAQLCRLRVRTPPFWAAWAATQVAVVALAVAGGRDCDLAGASVEIGHDDLRAGYRRWPEHPWCACRGVSGTGAG